MQLLPSLMRDANIVRYRNLKHISFRRKRRSGSLRLFEERRLVARALKLNRAVGLRGVPQPDGERSPIGTMEHDAFRLNQISCFSF
jgi:hypothetical protein